MPTPPRKAGPAFGGNRGSAPAPAARPAPGSGPKLPSGVSDSFFGDIDLDGVESSSDLPLGWYPMEVYETSTNFSSNGNPQLVLKLRVFGTEKYDGRTTTAYITKTPQTYWRVLGCAEAFGFHRDDIPNLRPADFNGRQAYVQITLNDFNGRNVPNNFRALDNEESEEATEEA